eukprot:TRINITY_DN6555_c1_g1_i2.p1 TRINITY_DN6555_c1_g1~~TRINITY_DN6555_c1_g1_i2.p1  ORF type:complete len:209 (-),score=19.20 TRINITY_DN6555_c1_g1_i2:286-912(-)
MCSTLQALDAEEPPTSSRAAKPTISLCQSVFCSAVDCHFCSGCGAGQRHAADPVLARALPEGIVVLPGLHASARSRSSRWQHSALPLSHGFRLPQGCRMWPIFMCLRFPSRRRAHGPGPTALFCFTPALKEIVMRRPGAALGGTQCINQDGNRSTVPGQMERSQSIPKSRPFRTSLGRLAKAEDGRGSMSEMAHGVGGTDEALPPQAM